MRTSGRTSKRLTINQKYSLTGWGFLAPAAILICVMNFYPMIQALVLSFQTGIGNNLQFGGLSNYARLLKDPVFRTALVNNFVYLIIQVPIMLILALILASVLNIKDLKGKGIFRTAIFLPCCTSLVSYAIIFKTLFSYDGYVNTVLMNLGLISERVNWLSQEGSAKVIIILALIWRWTGYNMVFYLAGLQNIDDSLYEAAKIDGCSRWQTLRYITLPLCKNSFKVFSILGITGCLKVFDIIWAMTAGGPNDASSTPGIMVYQFAYTYKKYGRSAAIAILLLIMGVALSAVCNKVFKQEELN